MLVCIVMDPLCLPQPLSATLEPTSPMALPSGRVTVGGVENGELDIWDFKKVVMNAE